MLTSLKYSELKIIANNMFPGAKKSIRHYMLAWAMNKSESAELDGLLKNSGLTAETMAATAANILKDACEEDDEMLVSCITENSGKEMMAWHLLKQLCLSPRCAFTKALESAGMNSEKVLENIRMIESKSTKQTILSNIGMAVDEITSVIKSFGENLTEQAARGDFDDLSDRNHEITKIMTALLRKTKGNIIITGRAGIGKTDMIKLLARAIVKNENCKLKGYSIFSINMGKVVAGTKYRGQFEERFTALMDAVISRPKTLVFIDEIHILMHAGTAEGVATDGGNLIKPYLTRDDVRIIGATTNDEYQRFIASDDAFTRRFQEFKLREPDIETVKIMVCQKARFLSLYHRLEITENICESAIELASIHVSNRTQPDITIDILDSSAARVKLENRNILTLDDILTTVSDFTGKPLESLTVKGRETLKNLENQINAKIVGQRSQARAVAQVIVNNRLQLTNANRPQGVFLFVGPTGVGKTAMAKEIAIALYGSEKSLQKLDMGEFNSADCINKLLGAPAGYIGHEQSGVLIKALQQPGSVILLDEIEKAHKDVIKVLLNLFDTGIITSSKGIRCDSRANIIIMTSNLFSSKGAIERHIRKIGFSGGDAAGVTNADLCSALAVDGVFTEELLGRIDKILLFNELQPDDIREIIKLKLGETVERLLKKRITLKYDKETLLAYIYEKLEKGSSGVRGLQRLIETLIIQPLASALLECDSDRGMEVVFGEEFYLNGNVEIK